MVDARLKELEEREARARAMGGADKVARRAEAGVLEHYGVGLIGVGVVAALGLYGWSLSGTIAARVLPAGDVSAQVAAQSATPPWTSGRPSPAPVVARAPHQAIDGEETGTHPPERRSA